MQYSTLLLASLAGLTTSLHAPQNIQAVHVLVRDITTIQHQGAARRANLPEKRDTSACISAIASFTKDINTGDIPTMPASLEADVASYAESHSLDSCSPSFTDSSLSKAYASYSSSAESFYSKNVGVVKSVVSACSDVGEFASVLSEVAGSCPSQWEEVTGGGSSAPQETGSSGSDNDDKDSAAAGVMVPVVGMAMIAGFAGLVL